ncbi:TauD/TfdA dioxygenase family protein [Oceanibacterium hippocampi]|uniref:Alpha-ketoglutarate-dependent 2,4-dichlorophenoxyacetate dioxygenase n=1 Tax=Oceanibacterium hippocampi TaxID=745714 RepID=A0A1Y5TX03_9PROT|nr:TauD/TfdA family dioxygenase [Oceanibacterium hippocampi]SLN72062.1 Alpha-ketoglutarate-dependent 2,4-dichlorophenoxyacetate dioxygenase [Oceanibacterium hippocampi]
MTEQQAADGMIGEGRLFSALDAPFGGETSAIDLSQPMSADLGAAIRVAFLKYGALVFRNQEVADEHLAALCAIFGPLEEHLIENSDGKVMSPVHTITNFDADGKPSARPYINTNYFWHSDKSYLATPSLATMLHPVELPASGGDTELAHMGLAYSALPEIIKQRIEGRHVVHSLEFMRESLDNPPPSEAQKRAAPPVTHPIVRPHAETGQPCLYIGMYASHIADLPVEEGRWRLARLQEQSTQPPFVYTHVWRPGDVMIWDNRCLMHRGVANYGMAHERRVMKRVCVQDVTRQP